MLISSWNVNSVRARIENIKSYLLKYKPDVVMMQEIKTEDINFPYDEFSSMNYESHVFGQKSYNGVAIISKGKLKNIRTDLIKDKSGIKGKNLFMPLRIALTGLENGPEMKLVLPLMKREEIIRRLNK